MKTLLVASLLFIASGVVKAQEIPQADRRQQNQHARIRAGITSGELTRREFKMLRMEQQHIHRAERRAKADGNVTFAERRRIENIQDRSNRHIYRARNNQLRPF